MSAPLSWMILPGAFCCGYTRAVCIMGKQYWAVDLMVRPFTEQEEAETLPNPDNMGQVREGGGGPVHFSEECAIRSVIHHEPSRLPAIGHRCRSYWPLPKVLIYILPGSTEPSLCNRTRVQNTIHRDQFLCTSWLHIERSKETAAWHGTKVGFTPGKLLV